MPQKFAKTQNGDEFIRNNVKFTKVAYARLMQEVARREHGGVTKITIAAVLHDLIMKGGDPLPPTPEEENHA